MGLLKDFWDSLPKWLRWLINRIDDPFDAVMESLHCHHIPLTGDPGYCLNISFLMKNRETTWDIARPCRWYSNCDPEDKN